MRSLAPTLCLLLFVGSLASAAENWPRYRGPTGDGMSTAAGLPLTWSESEHVRWKTPIHGKAWSSPVIWNDQIWLTSATPEGTKLFALCVDRDSGQITRDLLVTEVAEPQYCIEFNSYASCTPVIEEGRVYVHFGAPCTACIDTATGKTLWMRTDLECNHFRGPGASPMLYGNLLIVALDGYDEQYVIALDKHTGETVWRRDREIDYGSDNGDVKKAYCTGTIIEVDGRPQLVYPSAGATIGYEPTTGKELWRVRHGGMNAACPALYGNGRLFINTAAGGLRLFSMRTGGSGDVTSSHIEWDSSQGIPTRSSQILLDGALYMVSDAGIATCLDAETGKAIWQKRLSGDFTASAVSAEGRLYFCNQEGVTFVLAAERKFKLLATNPLDDGFMASPAILEKALYLRTKSSLYRIEE